MAYLHKFDWVFSLGILFYLASAWAIGANDVANSYATSVSSRTLTLPQAGLLAIITEFVGAAALGARVTSTIRSGILALEPFKNEPGVLLLAMVCAETGSFIFLLICTRYGMPVSTTQSIVGALVGVGIAGSIPITWGWKSGSVSQIAASWGIAPLLAAAFGFIIFSTIKFLILRREDPLKWGLRLIPFYTALTAGILGLFIVISGTHSIPSLNKLGTQAVGIILGVFGGALLLAYLFAMPYFNRRLVLEDHRMRFYHIFCGPLFLFNKDPWVPFPGKDLGEAVPNYYKRDFYESTQVDDFASNGVVPTGPTPVANSNAAKDESPELRDPHSTQQVDTEKLQKLPWAHPKRLWVTAKYGVAYGLTRDVITSQSKSMKEIHTHTPQYDNKVEHLFTMAQVCSSMLMSIAHGSNDVANAVGPFSAEYAVWSTSTVTKNADTPVWILAVAGLTLGVGFSMFGYHIMRSLGNKITLLSPARGYAMELGAAITVLMASRLSLPVSTTQCITGSIVGVALANWDLKSVNWRQVVFIFSGWVITLPCAGLCAGLLFAMAANTPHWIQRGA